ncbi:hypothetical protein A3C52_05115 [Candidatus Peribacteria bacterium RIFCSPHIGHO2_02_FULL_51_15]|nr:MAG: hypothetical protein A3C52_05115 [Candidatus Peribacteria bacterium RIFCSPHIGHO2_02_FULL_51_15]
MINLNRVSRAVSAFQRIQIILILFCQFLGLGTDRTGFISAAFTLGNVIQVGNDCLKNGFQFLDMLLKPLSSFGRVRIM